MTRAEVLRALLAPTDAVLFDFDGPLCDVFAGRPAPGIAAELIDLVEEMTGERFVGDRNDPHEVFRSTTAYGPEIARQTDDALTAAEVDAVKVSVAEPNGFEALRACLASGRRAAVVSNNAASAVQWVLDEQGYGHAVAPVVGRPYAEPRRMKPDPAPIHQALDDLGIAHDQAVLVGDSLTDIEVCQATGVPCVAYANKPGKRDRFKHADVVIEDMAELAAALRASRKRS